MAEEGTRPVFVRQGGVSRRRDRDRAPLPPNAISREIAFLDEAIALKPEVIGDFVRAGLVRRYDALEILENIPLYSGRSLLQVGGRQH